MSVLSHSQHQHFLLHMLHLHKTPLSCLCCVYYSTVCCNSYLCCIAQSSSVREVGICYFIIIRWSTCAVFVRIEVTATQVFITLPWFVGQWHSYFKSPESECECRQLYLQQDRQCQCKCNIVVCLCNLCCWETAMSITYVILSKCL